QGPYNPSILSYLLKNARQPLLIDADGLNTLSLLPMEERKTKAPLILTPHVKEFSRLTSLPVDLILSSPVRSAKEYAAEAGCIVLLKGSTTVITDGSETILSARGTPGMATAGSGDVLSGVIAGLLGEKAPTVKTVALGAYLTGLAGEEAARETGEVGMIAGDTVRHLPKAIRLLR
ncbi:MAG: NAD(P)H-hydrate dehydratase, partial [Clostridia bacterium]|nr:NAD(P)H-hydrate dehydratase [Clostridia bacterium]